MLANLSAEVRECLRHAEDCAERAKMEPSPALQRDYIEMERRWLKLARSYQLCERLQLSRLMTSSSAENSLIAWSNSSVSWPKIGDNAFGATEAKKERPRRRAAGPVQGAVLQ